MGESAGVWPTCRRTGAGPLCTAGRQSTLHAGTRCRTSLSLTPAASLYRARGLAYETLGDFERARADYETALQLAHAAPIATGNGRRCSNLGLLWAGRDYDLGDYYQQALALARTMDDPATLAHSLNRLGNWHLNVGQPHEALRCHQEALATFQALSDWRGKAATLDLLGMASFLSGDLIQGTTYCQQALVLFA